MAAGDGFVTQAEGIRQYVIKSGVTLVPGNACVFTGTDEEIDLPAGDDSLIPCGIVRVGGTGNAAGTVFADVYRFGCIVEAVAGAAIAAGKSIATKGTAGKVAASTTAGATFGKAQTNAAGDLSVFKMLVTG